MTGTDGKAVIQSPEGSYDTRLLLKRLAARLTVNWNYNVSGYKLKQLLIQSVPLNYSVVDGMESDGTYPLLVSQFTTLEVPVTDANAAQGSYSCWMPANVRGERAAANSELLRIKANAPTAVSYTHLLRFRMIRLGRILLRRLRLQPAKLLSPKRIVASMSLPMRKSRS